MLDTRCNDRKKEEHNVQHIPSKSNKEKGFYNSLKGLKPESSSIVAFAILTGKTKLKPFDFLGCTDIIGPYPYYHY